MAGGDKAIGVIRPNEEYVIRGSQKDLDLFVAWGNSRILAVAKGVGTWRGAGTTNKLSRLSKLPPPLSKDIATYVVFCSPEDRNLPECRLASME